MKSLRLLSGALLAVLLFAVLPIQAGAANAGSTGDGSSGASEAAQTGMSYTLRTDSHEKYIDGASDGLFEPSKAVTRAEAAQMVYSLLETRPTGWKPFPDVAGTAWYAAAAGALGDAGLMPLDGSGLFRPDDSLTRGDCARLAANFLPPAQPLFSFTDVPAAHPAYSAVAAATARGLFVGDSTGAFHPDEPLTRAEAVTVFNRLLGRAPDPQALAALPDLRTFPDVPTGHWAYAQIMEATVSHAAEPDGMHEKWTDYTKTERPKIADGFHVIDGWLYFARGGSYVAGTTVGAFTFGADGRYTTGNPTLDAQLAEVVRTATNSNMTRDQKLRALYNYVRDNFTYIKRDLVSKGQAGWETGYAERFFTDRKGNCFSFAAAFQQLSRAVGVDAAVVVGKLGSARQDHGWVEIALDGIVWAFDAELEMVYRGRGRQYDLFRFQYSAAPFSYYK